VIGGDQCVGGYLILLIITGSSLFWKRKMRMKKSSVSSYFKNLKEPTIFIMKVVFFPQIFENCGCISDPFVGSLELWL